MFEESEKHDLAKENGDYEKALYHANQIIENGKKWKEIDQHQKIYFETAYNIIFNTHRDYGDDLFNNKKYTLALKHYLKSDSIIRNIPNIYKSDTVKMSNKFWNTSRIGETYIELYEHNKTDSIYNHLFENYSKVKDTIDDDYAYLIKHLAISYSNRFMYFDAAQLRKAMLRIYYRDSIKHKSKIISTCYEVTNNFLSQDSLLQAKTYINKRYPLIDKNSPNNCVLLIQEAMYYAKNQEFNKAIDNFENCISCFNQYKDADPQFNIIAYQYLASSYIGRSQFEKAKVTIQEGRKFLADNPFTCRHQFSGYFNELEGDLYWSKGKLNKGLDLFNKAHDNYSICSADDNDNLNSKMAFLESEFHNAIKVQDLTSTVLHELQYYHSLTPSHTAIHNNLANANTLFNPKLSDSLFQVTLNVCKKFKKLKSIQFANALNGLGILALKNNNYKKADSLFNQSLKIENFLYDRENLSKLILLTNLADSKANQKRSDQFDEFNKKAFQIITSLNLKNTCYEARLQIINGDYFNQKRKVDLANNYYTDAYNTLSNLFDDSHPEIIYLKTKLKK